jgi:hypothetical protein
MTEVALSVHEDHSGGCCDAWVDRSLANSNDFAPATTGLLAVSEALR